jgi:hypothetical protein
VCACERIVDQNLFDYTENDARVVSVAIDLTTTETLSTIQKMLTDDIPKKVMTLVQSRLQVFLIDFTVTQTPTQTHSDSLIHSHE